MPTGWNADHLLGPNANQAECRRAECQLQAWAGLQEQDAVLSQGLPCDAAVNFGTYQSFQRHWAVFTAITTLLN